MVGGLERGKNCFTSDSQTYNTSKKINKRVMEKTGCLVTMLTVIPPRLKEPHQSTRWEGGSRFTSLLVSWCSTE